jgi:predicted DNA-binding transcriptional regulator YafY
MTRAPEVTRIARVLDIVWRISNAPHYWTRRKLAEEFEVSERSITSDLELIRHRLRFEILSERGRGYYFATVPKLPSVSYSIPEALALVLAAHAGRQFSGIPQHDLSSAIGRLSSVIPTELRAMVERMSADGLAAEDEHRQRLLAECSQAVSLHSSLDIVYSAASRGGEESKRRIDPYAIFPYVRSWHVVGYCHLREDVRIFKVDRMRTVARTDQHFKVRDDFDLAAYLSDGWGLIRGIDRPVEEVLLRFYPPASRWIAEERWHATQRVEHGDDGDVLFSVRIRVTPEFQRWVFRYGRDVDVIQPEHLREWVIDEARAVLDQPTRGAARALDAAVMRA